MSYTAIRDDKPTSKGEANRSYGEPAVERAPFFCAPVFPPSTVLAPRAPDHLARPAGVPHHDGNRASEEKIRIAGAKVEEADMLLGASLLRDV